ncbi:hypothetical protein SUGI_0984220 [Cryptomeria japonica]|nr:hypothetical protein SUGI_0984220 [Cryptomeria japonica]
MRIYQCGRQTVRVIEPDGQVRQLHLPAAVADLLRLHPHHCVSHAGGGAILPLETQLESGGIYLLSPLPRLFPTSASAPPPLPGTCPCFAQPPAEEEDDDRRAFIKCGPSIWSGKRHWAFSKISPEGVSLREAAGAAGGGGGGGKGGAAVVKRSRVWEPSLEIIVEDDDGVSLEGDTTMTVTRTRNGVKNSAAKLSRDRRTSCRGRQ